MFQVTENENPTLQILLVLSNTLKYSTIISDFYFIKNSPVPFTHLLLNIIIDIICELEKCWQAEFPLNSALYAKLH